MPNLISVKQIRQDELLDFIEIPISEATGELYNLLSGQSYTGTANVTNVVYITGDQNVSGIKYFSDGIAVNAFIDLRGDSYIFDGNSAPFTAAIRVKSGHLMPGLLQGASLNWINRQLSGDWKTNTNPALSQDIINKGYLDSQKFYPVLPDLNHDIDSRIWGRSGTTGNMNIFSTKNHTTASYIRNTGCWAYGIDLSPICVWNSQDGDNKGGILISPRHLLMADHYPITGNSVLRFVSQNNEVFSGVLSSSRRIAGTDIRVGVLTQDINPKISYARVFPSGFPRYTALTGTPVLLTDAEEKAIVAQITREGFYNSFWNIDFLQSPEVYRSGFYELPIGGDSGDPVCSVVGNQLVALTTLTGPGQGPFVTSYYDSINSGIVALGSDGGYRLTPLASKEYFPISYTALKDAPSLTGFDNLLSSKTLTGEWLTNTTGNNPYSLINYARFTGFSGALSDLVIRNNTGVSTINSKSGIVNILGSGGLQVLNPVGQNIYIGNPHIIYATGNFQEINSQKIFTQQVEFQAGILVSAAGGQIIFDDNFAYINAQGVAHSSNNNYSFSIEDRQLYNSNGNATVHWDYRILSSNNLDYSYALDWENGILASYLTQSYSVDWLQRYLHDDNESISANWNERTLKEGPGEATSLHWGNRILSGNWITNTIPTQPNHIVNKSYLDTGRFVRTTGYQVIEGPKTFITEFILTDNNNAVDALFWTPDTEFILRGLDGFVSIDVNNRELTSNGGDLRVKWNSSQLWADATQMLDWRNGTTVSYDTQTTSINWNSRSLLDEVENKSIDWNIRAFYNDNEIQTLDWSNRLLIGDWSTYNATPSTSGHVVNKGYVDSSARPFNKKNISFFLQYGDITGNSLNEVWVDSNITITGIKIGSTTVGSGLAPYSGRIYQITPGNSQVNSISFSYETGLTYKSVPVANIVLSGENRVGISVLNGLSGVNGLNISAFGYLS